MNISGNNIELNPGNEYAVSTVFGYYFTQGKKFHILFLNSYGVKFIFF